jgi:hypothetical protein
MVGRIDATQFNYVARFHYSGANGEKLHYVKCIQCLQGDGAIYAIEQDQATQTATVAFYHRSDDNIHLCMTKLETMCTAHVLMYHRIYSDDEFYNYFPKQRLLPWYKHPDNVDLGVYMYIAIAFFGTLLIGFALGGSCAPPLPP